MNTSCVEAGGISRNHIQMRGDQGQVKGNKCLRLTVQLSGLRKCYELLRRLVGEIVASENIYFAGETEDGLSSEESARKGNPKQNARSPCGQN